MEAIAANPAFRIYALCAAVLALKMLLSAFWTSTCRLRHRSFANPEDAETLGRGAATSGQEHPAVERALRIQRNDLENIPAFFAIGLVYVLLGASSFGAATYFGTYTVARVLHTVMYMAGLQPWRALCYGLGVLCMLGMIAQILKLTL